MKKKTILTLALLALASGPTLAQGLTATNEVIDCGQVTYQVPVSTDFELVNKGRRSVRIDKVLTSCGCLSVEYPQGDIAGGDKAQLHVTFDAAQMGHFNKSIHIYMEGEKAPVALRLKGQVVEEVTDFSGNYPFALGLLLADRHDIEFDDVNKGERPQQKIHIRNNSSEIVQPVVMHLPAYLQAEVSPSKIAPTHGGVVTLTLDSRKLKEMGLTQTSVYLGSFPGDKVSHEKEISVSAILLPQFDGVDENALLNAPKLELSTHELNLGAFGSKKKLKGEVIIKNTGYSPLEIKSMQMFTSGIQISLNKTTIKPAEQAVLKITADQKQLQSVRTQPRVLMITNDPSNAKVVVKINAQP